MNQAVATRPETSVNAVGIAAGSGGSKIAPQNLGEVIRFAEVMSKADIALPKHLRGNAGACMAVALQALEWEMSPFAVASKSYQVNGAIAYEAQLIAAVVNTRSGIKGRLKYEYAGEGEGLVCTVTGMLDGDECKYETPPLGSITPKNSPLWKTDPRQQLGYFAARSWARRHCPEVILGVYDRDEAQEFRGPDNAKDVTPLHQRLTTAREATQDSQDEREGFSMENVTRETETLSGEVLSEEEHHSEDFPSVSSDQPDDESGTEDGGDNPPAQPSSSRDLIECAHKLLYIAVDPRFETPQQRRTALEARKDDWKAALPESQHDALKALVTSTDAIIKDEADYDGAVSYFAEQLGCTEDDIRKGPEV